MTIHKKDTSIRTERWRGPDGKARVMHRIDGESPTLGKDLTWAFAQNVKRARAENRRLVGDPDPALSAKPKQP